MVRIKFILLLLVALFISEGAMAQSNIWRDIYKVKKKDTIYGIAQSYGITVDELLEANPEMKAPNYSLKKGEVVFIPMAKEKVVEKKETPKMTGLKAADKISIGVMLPLHNNDGDGRRMVEYYRGLLIACDSLRKENINVDIYAWNVDNDADIRVFLLNDTVRRLDLIIGPLYTKQVTPLANFCRTNNIKLVIPFSTSSTDVERNDHVYQIYQNNERLNAKAISTFLDRFKDYNTIFISCGDSVSQKEAFVSALGRELSSRGMPSRHTSLGANDADFAAAFSTTKPNVIVLNTARSPELNLVFRRLNELTEQSPALAISMFGYIEWLMYENNYRALYNKYDVYIPSTFYYYRGLTRIAAFERNYQHWFNETMQEQYIPRFALTGFDHGEFFIRGLYNLGRDFNGTPEQSSYNPLQTPLRFYKLGSIQGYQNRAFELVHYRTTGIIDTIPY